MRKRNRWIMLVSVILLLGAAASVARRFLPPPTHNLLESATKLADVQDMMSYNWLSSNELMVKTSTNRFQHNGRTIFHMPWSGYFDLIDARTGTRTRQEGLTAAVTRHIGHYSYQGPWRFQRSPDGQWLLWIREDPDDGGDYEVTARRDGSGYHEWKVIAGAGGYWIDGHRWFSDVGREPTEYLIVHDAAQSYTDRTLPYSSPEAQAVIRLADNNSGYAFHSQGVGIGANAIQDKTSNVAMNIEMRPANSPPNTPSKQIDTVTFPPGTRIYDNIPNPQMTRIEFLVSETDIPAYITMLRRLIPSYSYPAHAVECLCIYRLDPNEFYEVGRVDETSAANPDLIDVGWLPDGKRIQFFYKNAVYTVPID